VNCDVNGCLSDAIYWCVWGCYNQHIQDAKLCLSCMVSKKQKVLELNPYSVRMICDCGLFIREFFYTAIGDKRYVLMGEVK
jgi:hypothetical protein